MKAACNITELIGNTPLLRLNATKDGARGEILAKLEYFNPAASVKDRTALFMVNRAEKEGKLKPGGIIVEPTSGNTGIGIALIAATRNYKVILTMPESMSDERKTLLRGIGAELVLTPKDKGMRSAIEEAERITAATPGAVSLRQFDNPANVEAHYQTTAEEIWRDTDGKVDVFVSAVGTGGTITGVSRRLKEYNSKLVSIAVEPAESPVLSGGNPSPHLIQGIGTGFLPDILDMSLVDRVIQVPGLQAVRTARRLIREEGIFCGISSGAAAFAALQTAREPGNEEKTIVFIACDTADRYLSTILFEE